MKITNCQYNQQPVIYDLTVETLEMRIIALEREIERLNEMVTIVLMGEKNENRSKI